MNLELNARNLREEIMNYSAEHPNDFGVRDGNDRIPMKRLMKLFEIKKKTAPEKQNLFRELVNECCDLEVKEGIGKVLVLKVFDDGTNYGDSDDDEADYGYGEAAPTIGDTVPELSTKKADSDGEAENVRRAARFKPPKASASGGLSVATAESVGLYDENRTRRKGYRRRGSVTRYSIVGHEQVVEEYKKHEDIINQFRRDSIKIEDGIRNLAIGNGSNHSASNNDEGNQNGISNGSHDGVPAFESGPQKQLTPLQEKKKQTGVRKFLGRKGRSRFSLQL